MIIARTRYSSACLFFYKYCHVHYKKKAKKSKNNLDSVCLTETVNEFTLKNDNGAGEGGCKKIESAS